MPPSRTTFKRRRMNNYHNIPVEYMGRIYKIGAHGFVFKWNEVFKEWDNSTMELEIIKKEIRDQK